MNLFLHITGRRDDGYHLLQTAFQLLDYGDQMRFESRRDGQLQLGSVLPGVSSQQHLAIRAAELLQRHSACRAGATIFLDKVLPMGGGLGGGSSNAATTLVALNLIWDLQLNVDELAQLGLQLGADVPVFVRGNSAWGEGVGELLQPLSLPARWFVVLVPSVSVSTTQLFSHPELTRDCSPITIRDFLAGASVRNVFQDVVCRMQPSVQIAIDKLTAAACVAGVNETAVMTGSGSCVFLPCGSSVEARDVLAGIVPELHGFVAAGTSRSLLAGMAEEYLSSKHR